ncbi:MAG TPA: HAMP domain-containing sensor histidine kinase [Chitinophagaceae bacterium]|nr:HAMP domain-containing sensor histidine kinase [Chitinophagaceae bacterium]
MQFLKNIRTLPIVMAITILGITAFQIYWLRNTYLREKRTLEIRSNMSFRETVYKLQAAKLKLDSLNNTTQPDDRPQQQLHIRSVSRQRMVGLMQVLREKSKDPVAKQEIIALEKEVRQRKNRDHSPNNRLLQFLYDVDYLQDSITLKDIELAFEKRMEQQNLDVPFTITKAPKKETDEPSYNEVIIGFSNPISFRMDLQNTAPYLFKRISAPILLSLFIVGFTIFSFVLLYKNILRQRRLADIKNEFISNITHELKTPIATVSVAIEALRSFSANIDPQRSKEYLDISANELQRLSMLVDKVLKISMFEKQEIDLKYEQLDLQQLIQEVATSLRLQFEKKNAAVSISAEGNTSLEGDRLHLVSVIFNLLDNALKYSYENPRIKIHAAEHGNKLLLVIADDGIGIPDEYKDKVFEKFFRVPTGNLHNAKGYGLGLSYVAYVIDKHKGSIRTETAEGGGSKFVIQLPKHAA